MNRRAFLSSLFATAVLDPERLLWVPGEKKIFIPPVTRYRAFHKIQNEKWYQYRIHVDISGVETWELWDGGARLWRVLS